MKMKELREMSVEQLKAKEVELRKQLFDLRFQHATAQLEKTASIPATKKDIARVLTALAAAAEK